MQTPWGESTKNQQLEKGVFWVTTNDAGGILVEIQRAQALLSAKARSIGQLWYDFLAFEQDHAMLVVFYEQPHLYPWIEVELSAKLAEDCLRCDYPDYFRSQAKMELCLLK